MPPSSPLGKSVVRRKRQNGNRCGGEGQDWNLQARSDGTTRNGTGWLGENPSYRKGGRECVGRHGNSEAGGRCRGSQGGGGTGRISRVSRPRNHCPRLAAVCCQAVVICGSLLGCRGALTREKPTSVGWILVFANGGSPRVAFMAWDEDTLGFLSSRIAEQK